MGSKTSQNISKPLKLRYIKGPMRNKARNENSLNGLHFGLRDSETNHMSDTKIIKKCLESLGIRCCSHVGWRVCWHLPQNLSHLQLGASSRLRQPCLVRPQTWVIIQSSDNYPYFFHLFPHIQLGDGHFDRLKIFMVPISSGCQLLVPSHRARLGCLEMAKNTFRCWKCWEVYALSVEFS